MELLLEFILQVFGEILIQLFFEFVINLGFHSLADTFRTKKNPVLSMRGFALWGALAGAVSLLVFPSSHISTPILRKINLVVTPTIVGAMMMFVGKIRVRRGRTLVLLDRFSYGFVFALAMALVRYFWAT